MTAIVWRASRAFELRSRHATRAIDLRRITFQAHAPSKSIATMMTAAISKTADLILRQHCFQKFVLYIVSTSVFVCCGSATRRSILCAIQESL